MFRIAFEILLRLILLSAAVFSAYWTWNKWQAVGFEYDKYFLTYESNIYCYLLIISVIFILLILFNSISTYTYKKGTLTEKEKINSRIRKERIKNFILGIMIATIGLLGLQYPSNNFRSLAPGAAKFFLIVGTFFAIFGLIRNYDKKYYKSKK